VLPVHNFTYGLLTPGLAFIMSCLGAFLGLRCTHRARSFQGAARARWLLLGGVSIGATGIWSMHFIAMLGFTIPGQTIHYNVPVTILSLLVAVGIVCAGLLIVGFGELTLSRLLLSGLITGIGVATMHYMGMAAMRMSGRITYDPGIFLISVVIAVVAATAALWAALRLSGVGTTLGAAVIMGIAISGMHYVGMAAMRMYPANGPAGMVMGSTSGATAESFLLPLVIGIAVVSFVLTATITLSPTADEMRYDQALLQHVQGLQSQGPAALASPAGLGTLPPAQDGGSTDGEPGTRGSLAGRGFRGGQEIPSTYGAPVNYGDPADRGGPGGYGGQGGYYGNPGTPGGQGGYYDGPGASGGQGDYFGGQGSYYDGPDAPGVPGNNDGQGGRGGPGLEGLRGPADPLR
jgi:NO-binding membrane sensor protein with MHYT domain